MRKEIKENAQKFMKNVHFKNIVRFMQLYFPCIFSHKCLVMKKNKKNQQKQNNFHFLIFL